MRRFASLGSGLAVLVLACGASEAAASGGLNLGRANNVKQGTTLKSKRGPTLTLTNTGGGVAARFNVLKGKPPFAVSSRVRVIGLNADLLDGLDSAAFQLRVSGGCAAGSAIRVINPNGSVTCVSTLSASWSLSGNAGTNPATNFLGTTDAQPLVIRANNAEALRVAANGNVGIGTTTPRARLDASATTTPVINATANGTVSEPAVTATSSLGDGVEGTSNGSNAGVVGKSLNGAGVEGESTNGAGAAVGVAGLSSSQPGVSGASNSSDGVRGVSNTANGVNAFSDSGAALNANSATGVGVVGHSGNQDGGSFSSDSGTGLRGTGSTGGGVIGFSVDADGVIGNTTNGNGVGGTSVGGSGVKGSSSFDGVTGVTSHPAGGGTAAGVDAINTGGGDIFIGQISGGVHVARIDSSGTGFFDGGTQNSGADYAEAIPAQDAASLGPGDVLSIDAQHGNQVTLADRAGSQLVAGVYSTKPSVLAVGNRGVDSSLAGTVPVAMLGLVPTKVSAENGAIHPGDLLTTARTPGYAMKAQPVVVGGVAIYPTGTILGKALAPLASGRGTIEVLLMMR